MPSIKSGLGHAVRSQHGYGVKSGGTGIDPHAILDELGFAILDETGSALLEE